MSLTQAEREDLYFYVDGKFRTLEERVAAYGTTLEAMAADVGRLVEAAKTRPGAIHWPDLDPEEHDEMWTKLLGWVADVLPRHRQFHKVLRPCWSNHPDVVDDVTALWCTWLGAYRTPKAPATDAAKWLTDYLPTFADQVHAALASCESGRCSASDGRRRPGFAA